MIRDFEVSDVCIRLVEDGRDGLVGWATCVISNSFKLCNIGIRRGYDGTLYLSYPRKRRHPDAPAYSIFHPISTEAAEAIRGAVLTRLAALARAAKTGTAGDK